MADYLTVEERLRAELAQARADLAQAQAVGAARAERSLRDELARLAQDLDAAIGKVEGLEAIAALELIVDRMRELGGKK